MMGLINPSEQELVRLGISRSTYDGNVFFKSKLGGLCWFSNYWSFFYFLSTIFGFLSACGFAYGAFMDGEWESVYESLHYIPLVVNITSTAAAYHYTQDEYLQVFRSIDKGMFDYEGTLDEGAVEEITKLKTEARARKQKVNVFYTNLMIVAFVTQTFKKPLNYIMDGRGKKPVDGENNLIWDLAPFGMYVPYSADYWLPYIMAQMLSWSCAFFSAVTSVASALTYQGICEEILSEYAAIDTTLKTCVQRAERLFKIMLFNIVKKLLYIPLFFTIFDTGLVICFSGFIMISVNIYCVPDIIIYELVFTGFFKYFCFADNVIYRVPQRNLSYSHRKEDVSTRLKISMPPVMCAECVIAFMFCYYGQELTDANKSIGDTIYFCHHSLVYHETIKPYAIFVKSYCNVPNKLSAGGFTQVNRIAFGNILSAAYSYVGLLLTTS